MVPGAASGPRLTIGRYCLWVMETDGLFPLAATGVRTAPAGSGATGGFTPPGADSPLAVRMRPASLDELVGQDHLLAPGAPLRQLVGGSTPMSVILWGPPGSGKTTIAHLVAAATDRRFMAMSALSAGVKDVRAVIDTARRERRSGGPPTVLFIDEVHRFSKTQQDSLLAAVEDRTVTLLAATTENPYFSVISPLLSRCVLLTLQPLDDDAVRGLVRRATTDERGLGGGQVDRRRPPRRGGRGGRLEGGQGLAHVAARQPYQMVFGLLIKSDGPAQPALVGGRAADEPPHGVVVERLEGEQHTPGKERRDDGKIRILRGGREQRDRAVLHGREQ